MVIQRTIENLRERPTDERRAVAFGVSAVVVAILFFAWGIFFFQKVQNGTSATETSTGFTSREISAQNNFDTPPAQAPAKSVDVSRSQSLQIIEETATNSPQSQQ